MKTAIVTGASRGIGKAVAIALAKDGYSVALLSRNISDLNNVADEIATIGIHPAIAIQCDVSLKDEVKNAISELREKWSSLDLLFNNAGVNFAGTADDISPEDFQKTYSVNVFGVHHLLHFCVPWFKEQKNGAIINLCSIAGNIGFPTGGAYCSSKFAIKGLNESLHRELEPLGIRVTAISPSWVNTDMAAHSPVKPEKMIQPEDIAHTVKYILSLGSNVTIREMLLQCRSDLQ